MPGPGSVRPGTAAPAASILCSPRPLVCGILDVTPDSSADGGRFFDHNWAVLAVQRGAHLLPVHDVAATRDVLAVLAAIANPREGRP
jgi:dihydropteroate synthase